MRAFRATVLAAGLAGVLLSGCGTSEPATSEAKTGSDAGPVTVTDARDKQVKLDRPANKVVALEWGVAENLVSLGVMPAGVADVKGYTTWVSAGKLDASVKDVGTRSEPSADSIVALDPELVMLTTDSPSSLVSQLEKYVPVVVVRGADASNAIPQMRNNLKLTAKAVGKDDVATKILADFDQALADGKKKIADAGKAGAAFTMADGYQEGSTISIRMFTPGSLLGAVGNELGLKNSWTTGGDKDYGLAQTDVEGLTKLGDVQFLYIASEGDGGDPFVKGLSGNAIWKGLPFVKSGKVDRLPDGIWMFGGPLSTEQFIDAAVKAVTS